MTLPMCEKARHLPNSEQRCPIPAKKNAAGRRCFLVSAKKLTCAHPKEARHGTAGDKSAFHRDRRADKDLHPAGEAGAWRHHAPVAAGNTRGAGAQGRILPHWARGTRWADWTEWRGQKHARQADDGHPDADKRSCTVDGHTPWAERKAHVRSLGAVFGQRMQLWWDVPIRDSFDLLRDIYSIDEGRYRHRLDELTTALDLGDIMQSPLRQLSLGQRMRAELCGSLLHEPELLFLDEPTIGLDAVSKLKLREFLRVENETRRTTILLTTHDMEDMRALCSRVMVLGHGQLLYDGTLTNLLHRYDTAHTLTVTYDGAADASKLPQGAVKDGDTWRIALQKDGDLSRTMQQVMAAGKMHEMAIEEQNVDELIARMYREMAL